MEEMPKKQNSWFGTFCVLLLVFSTNIARADLLVSTNAFSLPVGSGYEAVGGTYGGFEFWIEWIEGTPTDDPFPLKGGVVLFDLFLSESDVGTTFTLDSGDNFSAAVSLLTNGVVDTPRECHVLVGTTCSSNIYGEPYYLFDDITGSSGIDLVGHHITSIDLVLDQLSFDVREDDPLTGIRTYINYQTTFNVYGTAVPIPSAIILFGSGLLGLIGIARHKKPA